MWSRGVTLFQRATRKIWIMNWKKAMSRKFRSNSNTAYFILNLNFFSEKFNQKMKIRYTIFYIVAFLMSLLCVFYSTVFCSIYNGSFPGWFQGGVIGLFLDLFAISIAVPVIKTSVRVLIRNFKFLRFLIIIDYSFFILNFIF